MHTNSEQTRILVKKVEPEIWKTVIEIEHQLSQTTLDKKLRELIKIRVSQINKCAYCIDLHTKDALKYGETPRRIFALSAWSESPLFTKNEKSALKLAEEITHISNAGVSDECYSNLTEHFNKNEIAQLILSINHMNFLNRIAISTKMKHTE